MRYDDKNILIIFDFLRYMENKNILKIFDIIPHVLRLQ